MALDAGSVYTILGGRFAGGGFKEFDTANKKAVESATAAESQIATSQGRMAKAQDAVTASAGRSAAASENLARSHVRLRESIPLAAMNAGAKSYDQAGKNLAKLGQVATKTAAVGILGVGAAAIYAASKATTFNREMLKISTQAGSSTAEVKQMSAAVLAMAGTVPQGPQKLAEALYHLESAGFRGAQAMDMLKAAAQGAALGNSDLESTTQAMISVMASQIGGVHGAADAMGQLNDIVGVGDVRMEDLAKAMGASQLLPTARHFGLTLKDVGAMIATTTDNATPAAVTLTRLRMAISLLGAPSGKAAKELATIGLSSTRLAEDMRKPNGGLVAIEDLSKHLQGLSKVDQAQLISKAFGGGRSSAGITLLLDEIGRLQSKYDQLGKADGPNKLAKSWAEFQKSNSATFAELKSGAEGFAITIGNVLLPSLGKLAKEGQAAFAGFVKSGGAAKLGEGITSGFETLGRVVSNLAGPLKDVAGALVSVGKAAGLGNAAELSGLIAAFLAFKGLTFVAPMFTAIAAAISEVGIAAATAPSLAAFGGDLVALAGGPVGAVVLALSVAAGAFVAFKSGLFSSTSEAERNAAAMRADAEAIKSLGDTTNEAAKSEISAERAKLRHKEAGEQLKRVEKEITDGRLKGASAQNALLGARLGLAESAGEEADARNRATDAITKERAAQNKALDTLGSRRKETLAQIGDVEKEIETLGDRNLVMHDGLTGEERLAQLHAKYNQQSREIAKGVAEVAVAEESRLRIQKGLSAITPANAVGVAQLQNQLALAGASKKIVTRFELDDQGAQAKLGQLATQLSSLGQQQVVAKVLTTAPSASAAVLAFRAILAGVPASKVIHILHNAPSARAAMSQLHSAISAVPSSKNVHISTNAATAAGEVRGLGSALSSIVGKVVNIVVNRTESVTKTKHASGRGQGMGETALVGEGGGPEYVIDSRTGQGGIVATPTIMGLGPDDYVVPIEERFRGRALGLFAMLARDLGVEGFKKGKHPKHKARPVPDAIDPLSLPLSDIETKQQAAHSKYEHAATKVKGLEDKVHKAERSVREAKPGSAKAKAQTKVRDLKGELAKAKRSHDYVIEHRHDEEWKRTLREAKAYQGKIDHETALANIAANDMRLADGRNDEGGYQAAKGRRGAALATLKGLIAEARKHVKVNSKYFDELTEKVGSTEVDEQATAAEEQAPTEAQRTGMTDAERKELASIEKDISLAGLTSGLEDDKTGAQRLVTFLEGVLGEDLAGGASDEAVKSVADQLKTAKSNLASFSGAGTNENADVQAQLNQEKERRETAERTAQIAEGALGVFTGSGDIGAGGRTAYAAAAPQFTINTLHPADPATLSAIGRAATAGIGYQGGRQSPRVQVGP